MRKLLLIIIATAMLATPSLVSADIGQGRFKLNLDTTLVGYGTGKAKSDNLADDLFDTEFDSLTIGLGMGTQGIGLGFSVIEGLVIGAQLKIGQDGYNSDLIDGEKFVWAFLPYAEYIFLRGVFRPFLMGTVGIKGAKFNSREDRWWWGFLFGGGGGAHIFIVNQFSVDLTLLATFTAGTGEIDIGAGEAPGKFSHWRFAFDTMLGISAWF